MDGVPDSKAKQSVFTKNAAGGHMDLPYERRKQWMVHQIIDIDPVQSRKDGAPQTRSCVIFPRSCKYAPSSHPHTCLGNNRFSLGSLGTVGTISVAL